MPGCTCRSRCPASAGARACSPRRGDGFAAAPRRGARPAARAAPALPALRHLRRLPAAASAGRRLRPLAAPDGGPGARPARPPRRPGGSAEDHAAREPAPGAPRLRSASRRAPARLSRRARATRWSTSPNARSRGPRSWPCCRRCARCSGASRSRASGGETADHRERERPRSAPDHGPAPRPRRARGAGRFRRPGGPGADRLAGGRERAGRARRRPPSGLVDFAGVRVELPPGAFLQATGFAEDAIRTAVAAAIGDARRIADLFAGCGTLGLPLAAAGRRVLALDADAADAGRRRARRARGGLRRPARRPNAGTSSAPARRAPRSTGWTP